MFHSLYEFVFSMLYINIYFFWSNDLPRKITCRLHFVATTYMDRYLLWMCWISRVDWKTSSQVKDLHQTQNPSLTCKDSKLVPHLYNIDLIVFRMIEHLGGELHFVPLILLCSVLWFVMDMTSWRNNSLYILLQLSVRECQGNKR